LLIVGVTGNGSLGTRYSFPFDRNVNSLAVQDAATRSTYFVWNICQACANSATARLAEPTATWQLPVNGNPTHRPLEVVVIDKNQNGPTPSRAGPFWFWGLRLV